MTCIHSTIYKFIGLERQHIAYMAPPLKKGSKNENERVASPEIHLHSTGPYLAYLNRRDQELSCLDVGNALIQDHLFH